MTLPAQWRVPLQMLGVAIAALIALFWRDAFAMADIWWNISTFTHCLFIAPITGWLIWQRWDEVAPLTPRAWPPALLLVLGGGIVWLLGDAASVAIFRHAGLVLMIQASVPLILGQQVTRAILFPLFYLVFMVPFGEQFVGPMQTVTAKLSMLFLGWAGIPAHIEGIFISIPSGLFEVAEACSGVKFLVAMAAYATLAANVCFKSWPRRIAFLVFAIIVPVIANGFRAYSTIHISHLTTTEFAESADHIIYGWVFFGLVMALVMGAAWPFFDRKLDDAWLPETLTSAPVTPGISSWRWPVAALVLAAIPVGWSNALAVWGRQNLSHAITLPDVAGWTKVPVSQSYPWRPSYAAADHYLFGAYRDANGRVVELAVAVYGWQGEGREIVGYGQGAVEPGSEWTWANDTPSPPNGRSARYFSPQLPRETVIFYALGGIVTGSENSVKIETLKARLLGGDQAAVAVLVSAEDSKASPARAAIDGFVRAAGPVDALAARIVAQGRGR